MNSEVFGLRGAGCGAGVSTALVPMLCSSLLLAAGCQLIENPFEDPMSAPPEVTTASVEGARAADAEAQIRQRPFGAVVCRMADGRVTHGPLYFEDSADTADAFAEPFALGGEDYVRSFWTDSRRFLANIVFFPVSVAVTPPWMVMVSDGEASRTVLWSTYDAEPGASATTDALSQDPAGGDKVAPGDMSSADPAAG